MKQLSQSCTLLCTPEKFWAVFFDEEYCRSLYLEGLQFRDLEVLAHDESSRKLRVVPRFNLPRPVAKLIGESFAYEQHGALDREAGIFTWKMVQPGDIKTGARPGMVSSSGTLRITDNGDGTCKRRDDVSLSANVFGLGGMIEGVMEKETRSTWEKEKNVFAPLAHHKNLRRTSPHVSDSATATKAARNL
jgi:hypothetical protein